MKRWRLSARNFLAARVRTTGIMVEKGWFPCGCSGIKSGIKVFGYSEGLRKGDLPRRPAFRVCVINGKG